MTTCAYTFDPAEWEETHNRESPIEQTWSCPHEAMAGHETCPFHCPPEDCESADVRSRFLEAVNAAGTEPARFIGATFGHLDLSFRTLRAPNNHPIDLRHARVRQLNCQHAIITQPLLLTGADIETLAASNAVFESKLLLNRADIDDLEATEATFTGKAYFDHASIDAAAFVDADGNDTISFESASFNRLQLPNAAFEDVSFEAATLGAASFEHATARRANFGFAEFVDEVSFQSCRFTRVDFEEADFHADASLRNATFAGVADFEAASFSDVDFHSAEFNGEAVFSAADFEAVDFSQGDFNRDVRFVDASADVFSATDASFSRSVDFNGVEFGELDASNATFDQTLRLEDAKLTARADFSSSRFYGDVTFSGTTFPDGARFDQSLFFQSVSFTEVTAGGEMSFTEVTFQGPVRFDRAELAAVVFDDVGFETTASFVDTTVTGMFRFDGTRISRGVFRRTCGLLDFSESTVSAGEIEIPAEEFVFYDVTDMTLGDVELSFADGSDDGIFEYFRVKNTTFDEFDFGPYKEELSHSGWLLHTSHLQRSVTHPEPTVPERIAAEYGIPPDVLEKYDSLDTLDEHLDDAGQQDPVEMEHTYLKAKNGAAASGDNKATAEFFRHEMKYRRRVHRQKLRTTDEGLGRLESGFNYSANLLIDKTTGYGERPRNVVLTSVATIGGFAVLYQVIDALPNGTLAEYVLFSLQNFVTFIIGTRPEGAISVRYLTAIQAFLGAFLIALFVFTLTRSIDR